MQTYTTWHQEKGKLDEGDADGDKCLLGLTLKDILLSSSLSSRLPPESLALDPPTPSAPVK